jgi:hypothetical protein
MAAAQTEPPILNISREKAEELLPHEEYPIVRKSSRPGMLAITYYNSDGKITHSLIKREDRLYEPGNRNINRGLDVYLLQGIDKPFNTLKELVEFVKLLNENKYTKSSSNSDPEPNARGGKRYRKRTSLKIKRKMSKRRRTFRQTKN